MIAVVVAREERVMMNDETFLKRFEACKLPWAEWTHGAHLRVAYLYLTRYPLEEAITRVRAGIQAHNDANREKIKTGEGYHETITQAFMRILHPMVVLYGRKGDAYEATCLSTDDFFDANPQLTSKRILLLYYTQARLMSDHARSTFVEPDLAPFPQL